MKEIHEVIGARRANKEMGNTAYLYGNKIYMYGGQKNLKYKDRWRAICNTNMWEEKLEEDIKAGLKIVKIENEGE